MKSRSLIVIAALLVFSFNLNAQQWLKNLPQTKTKTELTLFDYRTAFNSYWENYDVKGGYYYVNGKKIKAGGWKQFLRWDYYMESQINPSTGEFPRTTAEEQHNLYYAQNPAPKSGSGSWEQKGPSSSYGGYSGVGRLNCVAFHPTDNNTYWVGAPAGGLWKTTNSGSSWTCLTDNNDVMGVSDIVISSDYATSQTIYIATGDRDAFDNRSHGILKSTNGGSTWNTTGLSFEPADYIMVNRILADPSNVNILIAATTIGVYKTINGGTDWTLLSDNAFIDMEYKPGNFNTIYGSTTYGEIFVSTNGGTSWAQTMAQTDGYRTEIAVSPNAAAVVYAVVSDIDDGLLGVYKSTNSGSSFSEVLSGYSINLLNWDTYGTDLGGQGWYDLSIAASPADANVLLVGGVNTWRSTDGGYNWEIVNHWWGDGVQAVHADKHMLKFRNNGDLFECNDGGVYLSSDNGSNWEDKTNGMVISQMYKLGNSATDEDVYITGLQDNGTKMYYFGEWHDVKGGDGMECLIDYSDLNIQYGTYVYGQIDRTTDTWTEDITDISPDGNPDGAWVTPYIIHPTNPQILFLGYSDVYKTTNRGDSWTVISNVNSEDKIRSMAISPSNTQILYIADLTHIWKTTNGGTNWIDITGTLPVTSGYIRYLTVKNDDPSTVWITMSGYTTPSVYQTIDGGTTWTNISAGLPTIPVNTVVQNKLNTGSVELYCGTDYGVYVKLGSSDWTLFSTGLPNVKIGELEIWYGASSSASKIRAATYGRGLWESDLFTSGTPPVAGTASSVSPICGGNTSTLSLTSYTGSIQWQQSANGTSGWANVSGGSGATTDSYTTAVLSNSLYYRAAVTQPGFSAVYSNVVQVVVNPLPSAAGTISGVAVVCPEQSVEIYTVPTIANATSYIWTLPSGATGSSSTNSITVTFGASAVAGNITVKGTNSCGNGNVSSKSIAIGTIPTVNLGDNVEICATSATLDAGTGFSTYLWDGVAGTQYQTVNTSGTYSVIVTNNSGCSATDNIQVTLYEPVTLQMSMTEESSTGAVDGTASVNVLSGTSPFDYIWNNSQSVNPISNLIAGEYCVTVSDFHDCSAESCIIVTDASLIYPPVADFSADPLAGCGNLVVQFADNSTNSPSSWEWDFGDGSESVEQNPEHLYSVPGSYTVSLTVVNEDGSDIEIKDDFVTVFEIPELSFEIIHESSAGASDGSVTLIVSNGTEPYYITWYDNSHDALIQNLTAGTYSVTVSDFNNCIADGEAVVNTISFNDESSAYNISVFPNPAENKLFVKSAEIIESLVVYDATGRCVLNEDVNSGSFELNLERLSSGHYTILFKMPLNQTLKGYFVKK